MKLSDYVIQFVKENIADSIFLLSGGGIMHLVDSVGKSEIKSICCHHEQAAVIAAEGYGRIKNCPGVALVTTGPGGTNAITGIAGAWLDSIPLLVIAGQVKRADITPRVDGIPVVRQIGMQELNVIDGVNPYVKYAITIDDEKEIRYHLEKAAYLAMHGRPGPVFVEIPLDIQAAEIDPENLKSFNPSELSSGTADVDQKALGEAIELLRQAKRPLLLAGNGIRLSGGEEVLWQVLDKYKFNVVTPIFTADDLVTSDYEYYLGRQGMPGNKTANYAVDNCDVLLVVGERLQFTQTSWETDKFAAGAKIIMVDIDQNELDKKQVGADLKLHCDAKDFLRALLDQDLAVNRWDVAIEDLRPEDFAPADGFVNVYEFLKALGAYNSMDIATANGMASLATHQGLKLIRGQRFITNAGLGHMGSGLPMAIGASVAKGNAPVICTEGDGSIMLNIQELQTAIYHQLPIKIFIFNNNGYYSIRTTHQKFFHKTFAADPESGLSLPDFGKLIPAWGMAYERISNDKELEKLPAIMSFDKPIICELMIDPAQPMPERWTAGMYREI